MSDKKLLLITGAGASHDCIEKAMTGLTVNDYYRPPLTKYLFKPPEGNDVWHDESKVVSEILANHGMASSIGNEFISKQLSTDEEQGVESFLNTIKTHSRLDRRNQFWTVPIYLRDLFERISKNYIGSNARSATNYGRLLDAFMDHDYTRIIWLNLNYDLLGDAAVIIRTGGYPFKDLDDYMIRKTSGGMEVKYTKPHGSVDWVRMIKDEKFREVNVKNQQVSVDINEFIVEGVFLKAAPESAGPTRYRYPALTAPLGEYDAFVCKSHKDSLKKDVKKINKVLMIGFNALDKDILDFLKDNVEINDLMIVNGTKKDGEQASNRLKDHGVNIDEEYKLAPQNAAYDGGFSKFVLHDLVKWLEKKKKK